MRTNVPRNLEAAKVRGEVRKNINPLSGGLGTQGSRTPATPPHAQEPRPGGASKSQSDARKAETSRKDEFPERGEKQNRAYVAECEWSGKYVSSGSKGENLEESAPKQRPQEGNRGTNRVNRYAKVRGPEAAGERLKNPGEGGGQRQSAFIVEEEKALDVSWKATM